MMSTSGWGAGLEWLGTLTGTFFARGQDPTIAEVEKSIAW